MQGLKYVSTLLKEKNQTRTENGPNWVKKNAI